MSWYSARRDWVESTSSGGQDPNPLNSNFSNSFSCLCFKVSFSIWMPWTSSQCFYHSRLHLWLWHLIGHKHPCHWGLLLQDLRVCCTISHYSGDILPFSLWPLQCKHSVLSGPGVMTPLQHIGPEPSHSTLHQCMQSLSSHV